MNKKLIIACGGSGGHFYPGLALAKQAQKIGVQTSIFLTGKNRHLQANICKKNNIPYFLSQSVTLPKQKFLFPFFCIRFFFISFKVWIFLLRFSPKSIISMGSFYNAPICFASIFSRCKLFLHEANSVIGKSHQFFQKFSLKVFSFFPIEITHKQKLIINQFPLREQFLIPNNKIPKNNNTIFIFGGSQGSQFLNEKIPQIIVQCKNSISQIIHLTGGKNNSLLRSFYKKNNLEATVIEKSDNMIDLYNKAKLIICRAGASSIAEILSQNKKAILIPFPHSKNQHQTKNALLISQKFPENFSYIEEKSYHSKNLKNLLQKDLQSPDIPKTDTKKVFDFSGKTIIEEIKNR